MARLKIPDTVAALPLEARTLLDGVMRRDGNIPNMFKLLSQSPAALEGYMKMARALSKGILSDQTRERVALAIAELNDCTYCLSAHTYRARKVTRLDDAEITANRNGASNDPKEEAAVRLAVKIAENRGRVDDEELRAFRSAGYDDVAIIEIVELVALNIASNYLNELAETEVDFPKVVPRKRK